MLPSSELSSESYKLANVLQLCAADSVAQLCHQYRYIEAQQGSLLRISYLRQASLADRFTAVLQRCADGSRQRLKLVS